jgi:hypothetical protein
MHSPGPMLYWLLALPARFGSVTSIAVTISGLTIGGTDAGNYSLTQPTTTANITVLGITGNFTAKSKVYDGNNSAVVLTRGAHGMMVFEPGVARPLKIAALGQERPFGARVSAGETAKRGLQVFDVTGAGDTALATLALAVAAGAPRGEAAVLGNAAAGIVVSKLGTATVTRGEIGELVRGM